MRRGLSVIRSYWLVICSIFLLLSTLYASDKVIGEVNGVKLYESQVQGIIDEILPRAFYHSKITPEKREEFRGRAIEELIKRELFYQEAKKKGMTVKRSEIKDAIKTIKKRFRSEDEFKKALRNSNYTIEGLEKDIERSMLINRFAEKEIIERSRVSDEELKDYYEKNKGSFKRPEALRLKEILLKVDPTSSKEERDKVRTQAEEIMDRLKKGEDFSELAYKYSMDDWRVKGGDMGIVHKGRLMPEIEEVAFRLKGGEISIVESIYGYHIIKVEERIPETQLTFDEVKERLRKDIEDKNKGMNEEALIKRLKENARIEIY